MTGDGPRTQSTARDRQGSQPYRPRLGYWIATRSED